MNTSKQVNVMIGAVFVAFVLFAGYMGYEATRQAHAREEITERVAERGARLFVNNCRSCHGLEGEGHVAPPLNNKAFLVLKPENHFGLEATPQGEADAVHSFVFNTISCGRTNTFMPTWGQRYGGPLSDTQINQIVTMITEGRWDIVREIAAEHDPELYADTRVDPLPKNLAELPKDQQREIRRKRDAAIAVERAKMHTEVLQGDYPDIMKKGESAVLVQDPSSLSITEKNCGQFNADTAKDIHSRDPLAAAAAGGAAGAAPAAGATAAATAAPPPPGTVLVDLMDTLKLTVAPDAAPSGSVTFRADNKGAIIHELVVVKSDLAPDALPQAAGKVDETKVQVIGRTKNLPGKQHEDLKVTLQSGKYVLLCNIPAHYLSGMRAAFTVQ